MIFALALIALAVVACGGGTEGTDEPEFRKIDSSGGAYAIDDFLAAGFKKSKQYDVAGLPGGIDAYMGFFGPDPYNRKQFELRFYASHEDAVEKGVPLAEEVTGEDAAEYRLNPTWAEGGRDRWLTGNSASGGQMPSAPRPTYGDFAIYGNVLMLCEGGEIGQASGECEGLVLALREASTD